MGREPHSVNIYMGWGNTCVDATMVVDRTQYTPNPPLLLPEARSEAQTRHPGGNIPDLPARGIIRGGASEGKCVQVMTSDDTWCRSSSHLSLHEPPPPALCHERQHRPSLAEKVLVQLSLDGRPADGPHPDPVGLSPGEHLRGGIGWRGDERCAAGEVERSWCTAGKLKGRVACCSPASC